MNEEVGIMPKQFIGQVAMDEQQPSIAFSEDGFLWGQQSMSSMEDDTLDMSPSLVLPATPRTVGNMATPKAIKRMRMVRAKCIDNQLAMAK